MYPEGTLINPSNNSLIVFEKDINNPDNEGFVCFWTITDQNSKQLVFKKRINKKKAFNKYNNLLREGWKSYKNNDLAA